MACIAVASSLICLAGCSHNSSPAKDAAANQNMVQSTMQHTSSMDTWRQSHPGQMHP